MVDERTGHIAQPGSMSKSTAAVTDAIKGVVTKIYNANGHTVNALHGDAENINTSLRPSLGAMGIGVLTSLPGEHAHRAERTTQTINDRVRAVCSALPFYIPPELNLLLDQSVGECLNNSTNKASFPQTPNEALSGLKLRRTPVPWGRCAMVLQPIDKRVSISYTTGVPIKKVPVTELGVSMGLHPGTDFTMWLLANGRLVLRDAIGAIFPRTYVPFGWKPKPAIYNGKATTDMPTSFAPTGAGEPAAQQSPSPDNVSLINPYHVPHVDLTNIPILPHIPVILTPLAEPTHTTQNAPPEFTPPLTNVIKPVDLNVDTPTLTFIPTPIPTPALEILPTPPDNAKMPAVQTPAYNLRPSKGKFVGGTFVRLKSLTAKLTGHQLRKQVNLRDAAIRDSKFVRLNPPPLSLNNRATDARPKPPPRQTNEFPIRKALQVLDPNKIIIGIKKETDKCFITYKSLRPIKQSDLEPGAVFIRSQCIVREKLSGDITARIPVDGGSKPAHTFSNTYAGTSDPAHRLFTLAVAQADAAHRGKILITGSCDIPAAFINGNKLTREHTGGVQLYTKMPAELPPPYGGILCAIDGAQYGLRQSNHIYDQDLIKLLLSNGYTPCPSQPYVMIKFDSLSDDPKDNIYAPLYVDDFEHYGTSQRLVDEFKNILTTRYGPMTFHSPSQGLCGQVHVLNPDRSITLHYGPYLSRVMDRIGMDDVPPALSPDVEGLFSPSTDPTPLSLSAAAEFRTVNGELIHVHPLRHDAKKVLSFLLTKGKSPDKSDYLKQLHLLRYLKGTLTLGPTFSADPADYPNGVEIHSACDSAHNVHPLTGQSHGAYIITVGKVGAHTAPFESYSAPEKGVQLSPMESEYTLLSRTAKRLSHWRQMAEDLGHPQTTPSVMLEDNSSAIKLAEAPAIPSKSSHIALKIHHVRYQIKNKEISVRHQGTCDITPDFLTKHVGPSRFLFSRHKILATKTAPTK